VSNSPGNIGGFGAHHHLRQTLAFLNMPTLQQPEMYLSGVGDWFDDAGNVKDEKTREFLASFAQTFAQWMLAKRVPRPPEEAEVKLAGLILGGRPRIFSRSRGQMTCASRRHRRLPLPR
jgi:hypothetical protein